MEAPGKALKRLKITKDVPIPKRATHRSVMEEAFKRMQPGDSFLWHNASSPLMYASRNKLKITTRKENGTGYRVWLLKRL